ncbi:MAG: hypothetical protein NXH97_10520 [Rhodobacteraceae bacterium]|nr:hypothetical protein [Paracoccaceae bacterium]
MLSRALLTLILLVAAGVIAGPAAAHPGHFGELAGHSHWVAGAALGLAAAVALWAGTRRRGDDRTSAAKPQSEPGETPDETSET